MVASVKMQDALASEVDMLNKECVGYFTEIYFPGKLAARELWSGAWRVDWFGNAEEWVQDALQVGNAGMPIKELTLYVRGFRHGAQVARIYHDSDESEVSARR